MGLETHTFMKLYKNVPWLPKDKVGLRLLPFFINFSHRNYHRGAKQKKKNYCPMQSVFLEDCDKYHGCSSCL